MKATVTRPPTSQGGMIGLALIPNHRVHCLAVCRRGIVLSLGKVLVNGGEEIAVLSLLYGKSKLGGIEHHGSCSKAVRHCIGLTSRVVNNKGICFPRCSCRKDLRRGIPFQHGDIDAEFSCIVLERDPAERSLDRCYPFPVKVKDCIDAGSRACIHLRPYGKCRLMAEINAIFPLWCTGYSRQKVDFPG